MLKIKEDKMQELEGCELLYDLIKANMVEKVDE